jgi:hypothetical protein
MTGLPEPHRNVGMFAGLGSYLFSWGYSPRRSVERANRWLGQTAVTVEYSVSQRLDSAPSELTRFTPALLVLSAVIP